MSVFSSLTPAAAAAAAVTAAPPAAAGIKLTINGKLDSYLLLPPGEDYLPYLGYVLAFYGQDSAIRPSTIKAFDVQGAHGKYTLSCSKGSSDDSITTLLMELAGEKINEVNVIFESTAFSTVARSTLARQPTSFYVDEWCVAYVESNAYSLTCLVNKLAELMAKFPGRSVKVGDVTYKDSHAALAAICSTKEIPRIVILRKVAPEPTSTAERPPLFTLQRVGAAEGYWTEKGFILLRHPYEGRDPGEPTGVLLPHPWAPYPYSPFVIEDWRFSGKLPFPPKEHEFWSR